jgi:hypothetical protein
MAKYLAKGILKLQKGGDFEPFSCNIELPQGYTLQDIKLSMVKALKLANIEVSEHTTFFQTEVIYTA